MSSYDASYAQKFHVAGYRLKKIISCKCNTVLLVYNTHPSPSPSLHLHSKNWSAPYARNISDRYMKHAFSKSPNTINESRDKIT